MPTSNSAATSPAVLRCRSRSSGRRGERSRANSGASIEHAAHDGASRVFRARGRAPGRDGCRRRAHEKRSGRDISAAPVARRGAARPERHAPARLVLSCGRSSKRLARTCAIFSRAAASHFARTRRTPIRQFRAIASATSCCRLLDTRFAPGIVDILDREAAIAREDADYLDDAARAAAARLISESAGVELSTRTRCWPNRPPFGGG